MTSNPEKIDDDPNRSVYPLELAAILRKRWQNANYNSAILPNESSLEALIDIAYQASLLQEESSPVQCRVLFAKRDSDDLLELQRSEGLHVLHFETPCGYTPHEVRKLAAGAGYYRTLLGVDMDPDDPSRASIWGMVVGGTGWVNQPQNVAHGVRELPDRLVLQILGPGHLIAASGLSRVLETIGGKVLTEGFDPFRSRWLPERFASVRSSLLTQLEETLESPLPVKLCDSFVKDVAQGLIRRVLSLVRNRGQGGMLVYLSDEEDLRLNDWLRFRIRFSKATPSCRFQELMLQLMRRVTEIGAQLGLKEVKWSDFQQMQDATLWRLNAALVDFSHFLADLMSVDGSLVLNQQFRIVGFGAEILGNSHVTCIERALDLEALQSVTEPADLSGTRHRSAYRLVSELKDTIAVVVSQDGAVRFVACRQDRLVYWPYLP